MVVENIGQEQWKKGFYLINQRMEDRWVAQVRQRTRQGIRMVLFRMNFSEKHQTYMVISDLTQLSFIIRKYRKQDKCQDLNNSEFMCMNSIRFLNHNKYSYHRISYTFF